MLMDEGTPVFEIALMLVAVHFAQAAFGEKIGIVVLDMQPALILADDPLVVAHHCVPGVEVHFADAGAMVACLREDLGPGADAAGRVVRAQELAVVEHAGAD